MNAGNKGGYVPGKEQEAFLFKKSYKVQLLLQCCKLNFKSTRHLVE